MKLESFLPFVFRWKYELSEQRRENDRIQSDKLIQQLSERVADWKSIAIQARADLHDATARHSGELTAAHQQYHELAMNPPTGILQGPSVVSPLDAFGEKTREAIEAMSAGKPQRSRDAMIAECRRIKGTTPNIDDGALARLVYQGHRIV